MKSHRLADRCSICLSYTAIRMCLRLVAPHSNCATTKNFKDLINTLVFETLINLLCAVVASSPAKIDGSRATKGMADLCSVGAIRYRPLKLCDGSVIERVHFMKGMVCIRMQCMAPASLLAACGWCGRRSLVRMCDAKPFRWVQFWYHNANTTVTAQWVVNCLSYGY